MCSPKAETVVISAILGSATEPSIAIFFKTGLSIESICFCTRLTSSTAVLLVTSTVDSIRGGRGGSPDEPVSAAAFLASIDSLSFLIKADSSSAVVAGFIVPLSSTIGALGATFGVNLLQEGSTALEAPCPKLNAV